MLSNKLNRQHIHNHLYTLILFSYFLHILFDFLFPYYNIALLFWCHYRHHLLQNYDLLLDFAICFPTHCNRLHLAPYIYLAWYSHPIHYYYYPKNNCLYLYFLLILLHFQIPRLFYINYHQDMFLHLSQSKHNYLGLLLHIDMNYLPLLPRHLYKYLGHHDNITHFHRQHPYILELLYIPPMFYPHTILLMLVHIHQNTHNTYNTE